MAFRKLRGERTFPYCPGALPTAPVVREESASEAPLEVLDHTI